MNSSGGRPFVPVWLDEANLTANEFRVLCNLWRRADAAGVCWPSAPRIAADCRIHRDTVWSCLRSLEQGGWITRSKFRRNSNQYQLHVRVSGNKGPTQTGQSAESKGRQSAESNGRHPAESEGRQSAESEGRQSAESKGHEGIPVKEPQGRLPSEGVGSPTRFEMTETELQAIADEFQMTLPGAAEALRVYRQNKGVWVHKDGPLSIDAFAGWLRTTKEGKRLVGKHNNGWERNPWGGGHNSERATSTTDPEPIDWQKKIDRHQPGTAHASGGVRHCGWAAKTSAERDAIGRLVKTLT
jgi:hypothetical protein